MRFQRREGIRCLHVRYETHVDFRHGAMRQNRFAPGAGVTADQAFNVHRGLRFKSFVRLLPRQIIDPMLNGK